MCEIWKNGAEVSCYMEEVTGNGTVKMSLTWEIKSGDIANSAITNNDGQLDLLDKVGGMLASKVHTEIFFNCDEIEDKEYLAGLKQFVKDNPNGMSYNDYYEEAESEEITDGFPITVELVFEKNIKDLENMDFYEIVIPPFAEINIIADGKVVDTSELLSMINDYDLASNNDMYLHPEADYIFGV